MHCTVVGYWHSTTAAVLVFLGNTAYTTVAVDRAWQPPVSYVMKWHQWCMIFIHDLCQYIILFHSVDVVAALSAALPSPPFPHLEYKDAKNGWAEYHFCMCAHPCGADSRLWCHVVSCMVFGHCTANRNGHMAIMRLDFNYWLWRFIIGSTNRTSVYSIYIPNYNVWLS